MCHGCGAGLAVLALLCGLSTAPYTHAHHEIDSVSDEHHPHGQSLVHTHASPHAHRSADEPGPAHDEDSDEQIWAVEGFAFQQPASSRAPSPVSLVFGEPPILLTGIRPGADRSQPRAHGPPLGAPSGLRGPPTSLPTHV